MRKGSNMDSNQLTQVGWVFDDVYLRLADAAEPHAIKPLRDRFARRGRGLDQISAVGGLISSIKTSINIRLAVEAALKQKGGLQSMKALSIKQPWAWLIVNGYKDIENRAWKTNYRGPILVHASKSIDLEAFHLFSTDYEDMPKLHNLPVGGIVGETTIVDCVDKHESVWFYGPNGFVLKDSKPLPFKVCKGSLGIFDVPEEVLSEV